MGLAKEAINNTRFDSSKRFAVVIGTNYLGSKLPIHFRGCENDARAVAGVLASAGYSTTLLVGADATYQQINEAINQSNAAAGTNGLVIIYFSGAIAHKEFAFPVDDQSPRLIPYDVDMASLPTHTISLEDLTHHYLKDVGNVMMLLDSGHSGYLPIDSTFPAGRTLVIMGS